MGRELGTGVERGLRILTGGDNTTPTTGLVGARDYVEGGKKELEAEQESDPTVELPTSLRERMATVLEAAAGIIRPQQ